MGTLQPLFVELCAGTAAVTCWLHGRRPPCSRVGSKAGYAAAIGEALGLAQGERIVRLVENDGRTVTAMTWLFLRPARLAKAVEDMADGDALSVWRCARAMVEGPVGTSVEDAAAWWLWTAGARGGVGGFKGPHKHRPSVDGFIPSRVSLVRRLRAFPGDLSVGVMYADARELRPVPGAVVYVDPPYEDTLQVGRPLPREDVVELAQRWHRAGCVVGVSEREPVPMAGATYIELTQRRNGQKRRSMTRSDAEWLTVLRP